MLTYRSVYFHVCEGCAGARVQLCVGANHRGEKEKKRKEGKGKDVEGGRQCCYFGPLEYSLH